MAVSEEQAATNLQGEKPGSLDLALPAHNDSSYNVDHRYIEVNFDVFLCHNNVNKQAVKHMGYQLLPMA